MSGDGGTGLLGLTLASIHERLDRLELAAGISEPTPATAELDAALDEMDDPEATP